ncbi:hypothetical protein [Nocardia cyriacigeorgica]|nr:hypothetical protein [Nocardia cyriacigeorgica]
MTRMLSGRPAGRTPWRSRATVSGVSALAVRSRSSSSPSSL